MNVRDLPGIDGIVCEKASRLSVVFIDLWSDLRIDVDARRSEALVNVVERACEEVLAMRASGWEPQLYLVLERVDEKESGEILWIRLLDDSDDVAPE